jgi:hypothetical protein
VSNIAHSLFLRRERDLLSDRAVAMWAHASHRVATSAACAPIGQLDVKRLRHFGYIHRHGADVFATLETSR